VSNITPRLLFIVYRANNVLVDAQLSIQYLEFITPRLLMKTYAPKASLLLSDNTDVSTVVLLVNSLNSLLLMCCHLSGHPEQHVGSRSWPLWGDSFGIGRHFHCQILSAPSIADDDVDTWVHVLEVLYDRR
jgi:hypothetical protein